MRRDSAAAEVTGKAVMLLQHPEERMGKERNERGRGWGRGLRWVKLQEQGRG